MNFFNYEDVLNSFHFAVFVCDSEGIIVCRNTAAEALLPDKKQEKQYLGALFKDKDQENISFPYIFHSSGCLYEISKFPMKKCKEKFYDTFIVRRINLECKMEFYNELVEQSSLPIFQILLTKELDLLYGNKAFFQLLCGEKEDSTSSEQSTFHGINYILPEDYIYASDMIEHAISRGEYSVHLKLRNVRKNKASGWIEVFGAIISRQKNIMCGYILDITEQKAIEERMRKELQYQTSLTIDSLLSFEFDLDQNTITQEFSGLYTRKLAPAKSLTSYSYRELLELWCEDYVYEKDQNSFRTFFSPESLRKKFEEGQTELSLDYRCCNYKHQIIWVKSTVSLIQLLESRNICGFYYIKDIDSRKRHQLKIQRRAQIDALTQTYNRITGQEKVEQYLQHQNNNLNAFILLDLDDFKHINDTYGHQAGDYVLKEVGKNLSSLFRKSDIVYRMGGDEFCVLMKNISSMRFMESVKAPAVCQALSIPYPNENTPLMYTSSSMGIVLFHSGDTAFTQLYHKADQALYHAKMLGKNQFYVTKI